MSRPKADPIKRALAAYFALTLQQREEFQRAKQIVEEFSNPAPTRRRSKPAPSMNAAEAVKGE